MGDKILQWNVCGFQADREEPLFLTRFYQPSVLVLQENLQSDCAKTSLRAYIVLRRSSGRDSTSGGVALLNSQNILSSPIDLDLNLQAVCCQNLLRENSDSLQHIFTTVGADLYHLFEQLSHPCIVLGDFNDHSHLWGSDHCNCRGRLFEEVFNDLDLRILNDGSTTYCYPASGTKSMLDLSVAHPSLFLDLTWTIVDDLHRSDHFPVLVQFSQAEKASSIGRWYCRNVN